MSVLIITRSDDNDCVRFVERCLTQRGVPSIRLDTDRYPTEISITANLQDKSALRLDGELHYLEEVTALWYRRYFAGGQLPYELGAYREVCVQEARRALYGTIAALPCFQLDPLLSVRKADSKEVQLRTAAKLGLKTPRTVITNCPADARRFYDEEGGEIITKMQSSFSYRQGQDELVLFTTKVEKEHLDGLERLTYNPMIFQEHLPKKLDIRSTVVGKRVYSAAIDSQRQKHTQVDWRRAGDQDLNEWFPFSLPQDTEAALLKLTAEYGLNYGAADFVLTADDRLLFLELNAAGEWMWMRSAVGLPIDEAIADLLTDAAGRVPC